MTGSGQDSVDEQAAEWLTRLQSRSISTTELEEFSRWRREPAHAAAYERAQALWTASGQLSHDPDIQRALHGGDDRAEPSRARFVSHPVMMITALAAAIVLAVSLMSFRTAPASQSYQTAVGEQSNIRLSDGSGVQLDTDSVVAARFDDRKRRITLSRGQAFFDVAHAADRPFVVDAGDAITITAVGTKFDVRRTPTHVIVALVSGIVVVRRGDIELARMAAGSVLEVAVGNGIVETSRTIADTTSWRSGRLSFRETPLRDAVSEINRYTDAKIVVRRTGALGEPVSGEFSTDDPDGFQRAVNTLLGDGTVGR